MNLKIFLFIDIVKAIYKQASNTFRMIFLHK
jgi:hypothetical protein